MALWAAGASAAYVYATHRHLPSSLAVPAAVALLIELSFYSTLGFTHVRQQLGRMGGKGLALVLATACIPYLVVTVPTGTATPHGGLVLVGLASLVVLWFRFLPRSTWTDLGFLGISAGVYLGGLVTAPFPRWPGLDLSILGQLLWIRLGIFAALQVRRVEGTGFGFWPQWEHWTLGFRYYLYVLPLVTACAYGLAFARLDLQQGWWWKAPATFFGILWVVALSEEFFFRGLLQQWLSQWWGRHAGLVASSLAFGLVHLGFRSFPNWRFAFLAAIAGLFYGMAYQRCGSIRAPMVTHALLVTTWRSFFT